jgi:hypothetical protein
VRVRIRDASPIGKATLHYPDAKEVGFRDDHPGVTGDLYTFHIEPPGVAFLGDVRFAVEAVDRSARENRTMSVWRTLRLVTRERAAERGGRIALSNANLEFSEIPSGASASVELTHSVPEGLSAPAAPLVGAGQYWRVQAGFDRGIVSARYAPEAAWRLIESTLSLAYWDGRQWARAASRLDQAHRRITAPLVKAEYWTLVGEDRVLWRAAGRETGPALDDVDGDGKLEVLTVLYQPGELLSSRGATLARFPMDPPYRPVKNSSSPAVARFAPDPKPVMLFGSPSAFVYAFAPDGKRLWRTEVGGEVLGGPSVGRLLKGAGLAIAAAWEGGVSVIAPGGRLIWQRPLSVPARTWAVPETTKWR